MSSLLLIPGNQEIFTQAMHKWARTYLELGISRPDLQTVCRLERNPCEAYMTALREVYQQQDERRQAVCRVIVEMKIWSKSLAQLISTLAVP